MTSSRHMVVDSLQRFVRYVSLYPSDQNDKALAHAFSAAFGFTHNLAELKKNAHTLAKLTEITRLFLVDIDDSDTVMAEHSMSYLSHEIDGIRLSLIQEDFDIPLQRSFLSFI